MIFSVKILHLSDGGLPDTRIERDAFWAVNQGYEVVFAGGYRAKQPPTQVSQIFNVFERMHWHHWGPIERAGVPFTLRRLRRWLRGVLRQEEPDFIHAHDIYAAKVALDVGYPFIYDDHENWGLRLVFEEPHKIRQRVGPQKVVRWVSVQTWKQWEQKILRAAPTITVSHEVARSYQRVQPDTFVVPNLPNKREIALIPPNRNIDSEFRIAYIRRMAPQVSSSVFQFRVLSWFAPSMQTHLGAYAKSDAEVLELWETHRLGAKLVFVGHPVIDTEEVENHGFCSHADMLGIIADCDVALLGKKIRFPYYSFQNTYSLVMHAGLKALVHKTMLLQSHFNQQHKVGWTWTNGEDLRLLIQRLNEEYSSDVATWNAEKQRVRDVAMKHLLWENYADQLKQAYEAVQAMNGTSR